MLALSKKEWKLFSVMIIPKCGSNGRKMNVTFLSIVVPLEELHEESGCVCKREPRPREEVELGVAVGLWLRVVAGKAASRQQGDVVELEHAGDGS
jgi:hypothetical protein